MKTVLISIHRVAHIATIPLHLAVKHIPHPRKKKTVKVCVGVVIMLVGSTMAKYPIIFIPHILWDAIAYGLHGYGALPIIKILCAKFDLENLEEEERELKLQEKQLTRLNKRVNKLELN
jgi:hypothetical protein